ncbi:hypothetical protein TNCV_3648031 [Trichonephila clavipes]|nr:hypothetical protein TNCV_3648031 [Trichonephila clavipes]
MIIVFSAFVIAKSIRLFFPPPHLFSITGAEAISLSEPDEISNLIEEVVDLAGQINLELDSDDVQELLDSNNQELTSL